MSNQQPTKFTPRWYRDAESIEQNALDQFPVVGSEPFDWPRIVTRLLPADGGNAMSASAVATVINLTQRLVQYAARDVIEGINPYFADMRSISSEILAFSQLTIEPFDEGSFVIPARLESGDLTLAGQESVPVERVANRFSGILDAIATGNQVSDVSVGALQTVRQLNSTISREASVIEFAAFDRRRHTEGIRRIDSTFMKSVSAIMDKRQPSTEILQSITGTVTALDILKGELQLSVDNQKTRVKGSFHKMLHPTLMESLGHTVQLFGTLSYSGNRVTSISIQEADITKS